MGPRFSWASLPLIATVARLLHRELVLQLEYRRVQYEVVRSKVPGRIRFTDEERRSLVDAALAMGRKAMRAVVTIVKPETILRWQRRLEQREWDYSQRRQQGLGRTRTPGDIEALVCRMARENTWGYTRVQGELAKQGIKISRSCIAGILRRNSLPPSPECKGLTWREFLARHRDVLLCADLLRWIRSAREECLNHLILFGIKSLRRVVHSYARFFNAKRPHQGIGNRQPSAVRTGQQNPEVIDGPIGEVECEEFLGGLLKSYHRAAA